MPLRPGRWLARAIRDRAACQWARIAQGADVMGTTSTRRLREEAIQLRGNLDRFMQLSDRRLARSHASLNALYLPAGTDWRWRPEILSGQMTAPGIIAPKSGQSLGNEVALWHDCGERALMLRQEINRDGSDLAPYGLRLEVFGCTGSYLSLSIDMPKSALDGLTTSHILRLETMIEVERPINIHARANIDHGPNSDGIMNYLGWLEPGHTKPWVTEFDLALTDLNEKRLRKIWIDLIFDQPNMNAVRIRELFVSRHLRAEM